MRIYVNHKDVEALLGCARTKAYAVIREVNDYSAKRNVRRFPDGKANKYMFAEMYGIPTCDIDAVIGGK